MLFVTAVNYTVKHEIVVLVGDRSLKASSFEQLVFPNPQFVTPGIRSVNQNEVAWSRRIARLGINRDACSDPRNRRFLAQKDFYTLHNHALDLDVSRKRSGEIQGASTNFEGNLCSMPSAQQKEIRLIIPGG
jgi:hypothetical protein